MGEWGCRAHQVGAKKPNGFGFHDMHGNVWEWCEDMFDAKYYSKAASRNCDNACTSGSGVRVVRGGNFSFLALLCRSAFRDFNRSSLRSDGFGFRPARPSP